MEINKNINLGNGLVINYIVIYSIEVEINSKILVELHRILQQRLL